MGWLLQEGWKLLAATLVAGGGGVAIAYKAFQRFGEKWLDARFSERLEKLKHEQRKEIEGIRQQVQWHFSRVSKIHEKEFEIRPRAWFLLHEAHGRAGDMVGRLRQVPDFQNMPDSTLKEFVAASNLSERDKQRLLDAAKPDRHKYYTDAMSWIELSAAEEAQRILNNYLIEDRIFMTAKLADAFRLVCVDLALVNGDYRSHKQYGLPDAFDRSAERFALLPQKIQEIEQMIQDRLHYEQA